MSGAETGNPARPLPMALPILRCSAAGVPLGLAAEEVSEFRSAGTVAPHLAVLLGLSLDRGLGERDERAGHPAERQGDEPPDGDSEIRTLHLRAGGNEGLVRVDGPVRIRALSEGDLLAVPRLLASGRGGPVIGFYAEEGRVVVLVDVGAVLRLAAAPSSVPSGVAGRQGGPC